MPNFVWNRKCNRCRGQYYLEKTEDGQYLICIQCGRTEKLVELKPVKEPVRIAG